MQPEKASAEELAIHLRAAYDLLQKAGGTALGLAMSGSNHPDPDGALMEIQALVQEISDPIREVLLPFGTTKSKYAVVWKRG